MAYAKNKKGSILDLIFIGVFLLIFAVGTLLVFYVSDTINDKLQSMDEINDRAKGSYATINGLYSGVIDNSFLFLTVGLSIVSIILASLVRFHPVFFVFFIIALAIIIFISIVFSNIYLEMANVPELQATADKLVFTTNIMWLLPWIVGIIGTMLSIIMYKNFKEGP